MSYNFDRYLRYDELVTWLHDLAEQHPNLIELETYGKSHEGRDLWLATVTDSATGPADTKPAHWVDASIHASELTTTVAACHLLHHLVNGYNTDVEITRALKTRTFYIAPRVNPDGVEWVLADKPKVRRSSTRPWPYGDGHRQPGLHSEDIDGDGRVLTMRIEDPNGEWMAHPHHEDLMIRIWAHGCNDDTKRYRIVPEGSITDYDGFTIPIATPVEGLDLNRNFPAHWSTRVRGSGDHPLSEPEVEALVKAITARPNICGYHAYHTSGGITLRPSSVHPDSKLPPFDLWLYTQFSVTVKEHTGYPIHSVFEDYTLDKTNTMSGAADDWIYEHKGIIAWTTEFWDIIKAATGKKQSTKFWYTGPSNVELAAVYQWCQEHNPDGHVKWYEYDHPQLGPIELGGWDRKSTWTNPPTHLLLEEIQGHSKVAVQQALCSPKLEIAHLATTALDGDLHRIDIGIANTGWLSTDITAYARKHNLVLPVEVTLLDSVGNPAQCQNGSHRRRLDGHGQLEGRAAKIFQDDGTHDRALVSYLISAEAGSEFKVSAAHPRCGKTEKTFTL